MAKPRTDRELLEQLVAGQEALNQKVDFIAKRTDERFGKVDQRFDVVIKTMQAGFTENKAEHAEFRRAQSEQTGKLTELASDVKHTENKLTLHGHRLDQLGGTFAGLNP